MSCDTIDDCVYVDPSLPTSYQSVNSLTFFAINVVMYSIYAFLVIFVVYNIVKAIYNIVISPSEETLKKLRSGFTNAILGALGILIIISIRFLIRLVFVLLDIPDIDNVFINIPTL